MFGNDIADIGLPIHLSELRNNYNNANRWLERVMETDAAEFMYVDEWSTLTWQVPFEDRYDQGVIDPLEVEKSCHSATMCT